MSKIKILVMGIENAGVSKFRFEDPHIMLQSKFKDDFHIDIVSNPNIQDKSLITQYHAVFAQSSMLMSGGATAVINQIKSWGVKFIVDMDDYWELPLDHPLKKRFDWEDRIDKQEKEISENPKKDPEGKLRENIENTRKNNRLNHGGSVNRMLQNLKLVDMIITTTKMLASELFKYNRNVHVIPNAINPDEKQFQSNSTESDRIRIGWAGGSSHLEDLKLLAGLPQQLQQSKQNAQMVMCGFDNRTKNIGTGKTTPMDFRMVIEKIKKDYGGDKLKAAKHGLEIPVWVECEKKFTNAYDFGDVEYSNYLQTYANVPYPDIENKPYRRIWSSAVQEFAECYNSFDIALAPLREIKFNRMKSQLKMLEAGFHKKPLVCSFVSPYRIDGISGKNCLMPTKNDKMAEWYKKIKSLIVEPNLRLDLGNSLYETVKDKYNLHNVTNLRKEIYQQTLK